MKRIEFFAIIGLAVFLGLLSQTLLAAKLEVACTVTAGISDGPNPNPACVGEKVTVELTADVPPLYREECDNFTEMWSWSILSVTFNGEARPTSKFQLSNSNSRKPTLTAPEGSLDEEGTWVVTVKVTGTFTSEACEDCTSSAELPITVEVGCGRVQEVSYTGDTYTAVYEDGPKAKPYTAPHWQDTDDDGNARDTGKMERRFPVSYRRDSFMVIEKAVFKTCEEPEQAKVRGSGADGINVPATDAAIAGNIVTISNVQVSAKFPNTIKFYNTFNIAWELSFDGGVTWCKAGTSDNRVYVRLEDPIGGVVLHETLLDVGCRNAGGQNTKQGAFSAFWADFADRSVSRKTIDGHNQMDQQILRYWVNEDKDKQLLPLVEAQCQKMVAMLDPSPTPKQLNGIGTCEAWALFLRSIAQAQGIDGVRRLTVEKNPMAVAKMDAFLVKDWKFTQHIHCGANSTVDTAADPADQLLAAGIKPGQKCRAPNQPYLFPGSDGVINTVPKPDDMSANGAAPVLAPLFKVDPGPYTHILHLDTLEQTGIAAQNNSDPPSKFPAHVFARYSGVYYDPSYGTSFGSKNAWENGSIDGFVGPRIGNLFLTVQNKAAEELAYDETPDAAN